MPALFPEPDTLEPWSARPTINGGWTILDKDGAVVAGISGAALHRDNPAANARLIAAAPALLAAARRSLAWLRQERDVFFEGCADAEGRVHDNADADVLESLDADIAFLERVILSAGGGV